jgi:hypothetical protein
MGTIRRRYHLLLGHHLAIVLLWALVYILPSPFDASVFAVLLLLHLALPLSSAWVSRRRHPREALLLGPGLPVALYTIVLLTVLTRLDWGNPESTWLTLVLLVLGAASITLYAGYSLAVFSFARRLFERKR